MPRLSRSIQLRIAELVPLGLAILALVLAACSNQPGASGAPGGSAPGY
jgi:hypothetical protein